MTPDVGREEAASVGDLFFFPRFDPLERAAAQLMHRIDLLVWVGSPIGITLGC